MRSGKRRRWPWAVVWTLAVALAAVAVLLITGVHNVAGLRLPPAEHVRNWLAAGCAIGGAVLAGFGWAYRKTHDPPAMSDGERIDVAKRLLAMEVNKQRTEEARHQGWKKRPLIPVCWRTPEDPRVPSHTGAVKSPPRTASSDEIAELAEKFRACQPRRLVVLGGPGMGKTTLVVLLLLELLATRKDPEGEPVPVFFPVEQWDTKKYPRLQEWLAEQLYQDHPCLRWFGVDGVRTMVDLHEVLPILDGLDELPEAAQTTVIERLNASLDSRDQLIITSRTAEYTDAVGAGRAVNAAAVLEPLPVTPDAAAEYLKGSLQSHQQSRPAWARVLEILRTEPGSALAEVTKTPLGLWLLCTVYVEGDGNPDELTDPARFSTSDKLRAHLFDHLIAALLPPDGDKRRAKALGLSRTYQADDVERWLGFLARHLSSQPSRHDPDRHGTRDFEWWRLAATTGRTPPPNGIALTFGLVVGLVAGLTSGIVVVGTAALTFGLVVGLTCGPVVARSADQPPGVADLRASRGRHTFTSTLGSGLVLGLVLVPVLGVLIELMGVLGPMDSLVLGLVNGPVLGLVVGLVTGIFRWIEAPSLASEANSPQASLRSDRTLNLVRIICSYLVGGLVGELMVGLVAGPAFGLAFGLEGVLVGVLLGGLYGGLVFGLTLGQHRAWVAYVWATWRLSREGVLPRKLMPFLDDMHRLGLLRAVGRVYQFRHAELQDHLAETYRRSG